MRTTGGRLARRAAEWSYLFAAAVFGVQEKEQCPLAKHREFKGVVAHAVTRAVVYDDMRCVPPYPLTTKPCIAR